jgi:hypothetical protein
MSSQFLGKRGMTDHWQALLGVFAGKRKPASLEAYQGLPVQKTTGYF